MSEPLNPVRTQARAIIERDGHIALVKSVIDGWAFWVLPGGGQDLGEVLTDTVRRECQEELGVDVEVGPLRIVREYVPDQFPDLAQFKLTQCIDFIFQCSLSPDQDIRIGTALEAESVDVAWQPLDELSSLALYPDALQAWFTTRKLDEADITYLGVTR